MKRIIIHSEELRKYTLVFKNDSFKKLNLSIMGQKLSGTIIVNYNEKCVEIPPGAKFKINED